MLTMLPPACNYTYAIVISSCGKKNRAQFCKVETLAKNTFFNQYKHFHWTVLKFNYEIRTSEVYKILL